MLWLNTPIGGCARYQNDNYQREDDTPEGVAGNPWFIATLPVPTKSKKNVRAPSVVLIFSPSTTAGKLPSISVSIRTLWDRALVRKGE